MHTLGCCWVYIGVNWEDWSWVDFAELRGRSDATLYITAIYWITMTLTTVGYGEIRGTNANEFVYVMIVQFVGIMFFSFIMGSIS
jgi:hypothetical protein